MWERVNWAAKLVKVKVGSIPFDLRVWVRVREIPCINFVGFVYLKLETEALLFPSFVVAFLLF